MCWSVFLVLTKKYFRGFPLQSQITSICLSVCPYLSLSLALFLYLCIPLYLSVSLYRDRKRKEITVFKWWSLSHLKHFPPSSRIYSIDWSFVKGCLKIFQRLSSSSWRTMFGMFRNVSSAFSVLFRFLELFFQSQKYRENYGEKERKKRLMRLFTLDDL